MDTTTAYSPTGVNQPLQMISFKEKSPEWFKNNVDYRISRSRFDGSKLKDGSRDINILYQVYNNKYPMDWFKHITNPISATKKEHQNYGAKIRPVTIIRTNIDLLLGEYPKRPFIYNVANLGDTGYSEYNKQLMGQVQQNLEQHFINFALQNMQAQGQQLTPEQMQKLQQAPPVPEDVKADFDSTYKDIIAIKGQRWLKRVLREQNIKRKLGKIFKDWLISGEVNTFKTVRHNRMVYEQISPLQIEFFMTESTEFGEDADAVVCRYDYTLADIVDKFWDKLDHSDLQNLEKEGSPWHNPSAMYSYMLGNGWGGENGTIPCWHVQWIGYKKIKVIARFDPSTFQMVEEDHDEEYKPDESQGEKVVKEYWVNERYEGWRFGSKQNNLYADLKASDLQRTSNGMYTKPKLDYNCKRFSDSHSDNISVLEIGLPFQLMFIIVNYILEKTIAKSKGKIFLLDKNVVPKGDGWDEEKFFYYAEALGYALIDRNRQGVDKSWNQYQVLDGSLFDQIKQLIELQESLKQQWDDILGITRQRKGQTYASDGQGVNERSVFQSTVITDHIFAGFEEFQERELQGFMDLGKVITASGENSIYYDDMVGAQVLSILPEDFTNADLGVFVDGSAEHMRKMQQAQSYAQAMLQNNAKVSTVLEVIDTDNMAELRRKVHQIESIEMQIAQQQAESEQEAEQQKIEIQEKYQQFLELLKRESTENEYDRKEQLEWVKNEAEAAYPETSISEKGTAPEQQVFDPLGIARLQLDRQKAADDKDARNKDRDIRRIELKDRIRQTDADIRMRQQELGVKKTMAKAAVKKASQKPKTSTAKK